MLQTSQSTICWHSEKRDKSVNRVFWVTHTVSKMKIMDNCLTNMEIIYEFS